MLTPRSLPPAALPVLSVRGEVGADAAGNWGASSPELMLTAIGWRILG